MSLDIVVISKGIFLFYYGILQEQYFAHFKQNNSFKKGLTIPEQF